MNKNKKITMIVIGALILAAIISVLVLSISKDNVNLDNEDIEIMNPQDEAEDYLFNLTFDYKAELKDEYVLDLKDEKITMNTENIVPEVNTNELGQTKHTVNVDDKEITLVIDIVDNRTIELSKTSIEIKAGTSLDKLNKQIYAELILGNLEDVKYEIEASSLDLNTPGEGEVDLFVYYVDNEDNNVNFKIDAVIVETNDLDRSDVAEQPKPVEPKPEQPKPEQPKPVEPKPEQPKPVEPNPDSGNAKYPLVNPGSLPSDAKLTKSEINPNEEFHKYNYSESLSGQGSISEVYINLSSITGKTVGINGKDINGEPLYYNFNIDTGKVQYEWVMPELTSDDKAILKKVAKQFAAAYGQ